MFEWDSRFGGSWHDRIDRHITGGRYSSSVLLVTCAECGEETVVTSETEYGATTWTPEECANKKCNATFAGNEQWEESYGPDYD